jgi:hypothetical protein
VRGRGCLDARPDAELGQDARHVDAGRLLGDEERRADLAVRVPLRDEGQDRELARGEAQAVDLRIIVIVRHCVLSAQLHASAPRQPLDLSQEQRRAQGRGDLGGLAQRGLGGGPVTAAGDQRLALAPTGVAELERQPQRREVLRGGVPGLRVGGSLGARELGNADRFEGDRLGPGRAFWPALSSQESA